MGVPRACHRRASLNPPGWAGSRQTEIGCGRVTQGVRCYGLGFAFLLSLSHSQTRVPLVASGLRLFS